MNTTLNLKRADPGSFEDENSKDTEPMKIKSQGRLILERFLEKKQGLVSLIVVLLLILVAILAPVIAPHDPYTMTKQYSAPPSSTYLLGTDNTGRDTFSRLIYASRVSLLVGFGVMIINIFLGTVLGLISGYWGKWVDSIIMRLADILMVFPPMILILVVVGVVGQGLWKIIFILGVLGWPQVARLVRGEVLAVKQMNYVKAGIMIGYSTKRILFKHILPNVTSSILVTAIFRMTNAIVTEAALSFLGMGVQLPTPSWGNMLTDAKSLTVLASRPWQWVPPCLMIVIIVIALNFIGDSLRDALDPSRVG